MKQDEARGIILSLFQDWCAEKNLKNPTGTDGFIFYMGLEKQGHGASDFRCKGDRWQTVHGWLLEAGLVSD